MRISHLNAMRAVEATLRLGSFTKAAQEIGITPAAVGQRVRLLEDYLGVALFERSAAGILPTDAAHNIESALTTGFTALAQAYEVMSEHFTQGPLRVTLPESFAENWLTPVLSDFRTDHPDFELYLEPTNRDVDLGVEDFDLAIRYGTTSTKGLKERVLFGDHVVPVCTPRFAAKYDLHPGQTALEGVPLIFVAHRTNDPGWVGFEEWGAMQGIDPAHLKPTVHISKTGSGLQAAISDQGLVLCGIVEAFHALKTGLLVLPFGLTAGCETRYAYRLVWAKSRPPHHARQAFIDWMVAKSEAFVADLNAYRAEQRSTCRKPL